MSGVLNAKPSHSIDTAGFDFVEEGWVVLCSCGFCTDAHPLMEQTGMDFDNHLRKVGVLVEG